MSKTINDISLIDIMPQSLLDDPLVKAIAMALDPELKAISSDIDFNLIWSRIDELAEDVIDLLAWQLHCDFYESNLPLETKRTLVKGSTSWHRHKGTPWAVEQVILTVFGRCWVDEWFEYGGDPYYFRVNVEASQQGASADDLIRLENLVNQYKNTRSWLEVINIFLSSIGSLYIASSLIAGEHITVYPWNITDVSSSGMIRVSLGYQAVETTTIYPL